MTGEYFNMLEYGCGVNVRKIFSIIEENYNYIIHLTLSETKLSIK